MPGCIRNDVLSGTLLTVNAGSSSLKLAAYDSRRGDRPLASTVADRLGTPDASLEIESGDSTEPTVRHPIAGGHAEALRRSLDELESRGLDPMHAVGHRVVHGGLRHSEPEIVTPDLVASLREFVDVDPDHMPIALQLIEQIGQRYQTVAQVACFDTGFHRSLPAVARMYPLPPELTQDRVVRYGFHGLSCESIVGQLSALAAGLPERLIVAHLGNGASLTAIRSGASLETTMGFSPTGGLVMGSRSGDLDPSVLLYLARVRGLSFERLTRLVNAESGLIGISGTTADMRGLLEREPHDRRASEAVALFCYTARKFIGALVAVLGGLDALVFTGGIGEHAAVVRARICEGLECIAVRLDPGRNAAHAPVISPDGMPVTVRVMRTDEDLVIARHTRQLLGFSGSV